MVAAAMRRDNRITGHATVRREELRKHDDADAMALEGAVEV